MLLYFQGVPSIGCLETLVVPNRLLKEKLIKALLLRRAQARRTNLLHHKLIRFVLRVQNASELLLLQNLSSIHLLAAASCSRLAS